MRCYTCGAALREGVLFCEQCGAQVWDAGETAEVQTASGERKPASLDPSHPPSPPSVAESRGAVAPTGAPAATSDAFSSAWSVLLPDGRIVSALVPLLLGRKPTPDAGPIGAHLVQLRDADQSASRAHALIEPTGPGAARVTNTSSRSTVPVAWPSGVRFEIAPGGFLDVTSTCELTLGNVKVLLQRG